jgi:ABC-type transport system substrate-binding protein
MKAESLVPPGVIGHDPAYRSTVVQDRQLANRLLDEFGYTKRDPDGNRRDPQDRPLTLNMHSEATVAGRLRDEMWRRVLQSIGIRVRFVSDKKSEIIKASRHGKVQMFETNWIADFADADNFVQLLYGPNTGRSNYARFRMATYDRLLDRARSTPEARARQDLYRQMNQILHAYNPIIPLTHPISADIQHTWLRNYKRHPVELTVWRYLDIDTAARAKDNR